MRTGVAVCCLPVSDISCMGGSQYQELSPGVPIRVSQFLIIPTKDHVILGSAC